MKGSVDPLFEDTRHRKFDGAKYLLASQQSVKTTIGGFFDFYLEKRADLKPSTRTNLLQVRKEMVLFFGEDKPLVEVNEGEAED